MASGRVHSLIVAVVLSVVTCPAPGIVPPAAAQAAKPWEFGAYRQFTPPPMRSAPSGTTTRAAAPMLKLSRVAVQRPQVAPGETANLIAEYEVSVAQETIEVKETRVIRFEGQQVATLEKIVSLPRGTAGSTVALTVPSDAAPGLYTITTTIEPRAAVGARNVPSAGADDRANSMFRVQARSATPAAAPAGPPAAPTASAPAAPPATGGDAPAQFKLWTDKTTHKIGEPVKVFFQANRNGYVTLVNVGTSGKITILYPNAYTPNHAVKAGQTYSVPSQEDPYELTLGGPEGVELVYALFTTGPTRFIEENLTKDTAFAPVNEKAEAITRDINLTVKKIPLKEQASAVLEIEVSR
jgi:hypothetical protein